MWGRPPVEFPNNNWVLSHTVTGSAGQNTVRWYEFVAPEHTVPVTALTVAQQGTYAPDAHHRFRSSIARDKAGDILVGYTVSDADIYPEIAMAGRTVSDPLGTLEPEQVVFSGTLRKTPSIPPGATIRVWQWTRLMAVRSGTSECTTQSQALQIGAPESLLQSSQIVAHSPRASPATQTGFATGEISAHGHLVGNTAAASLQCSHAAISRFVSTRTCRCGRETRSRSYVPRSRL